MKCYVTYRITAKYIAEVEVDDPHNLKQIRQKANEKFSEADFGDAQDIDGTAISIEDEDGNNLM